MHIDDVCKKIDRIDQEHAIITDIELMDGTLIQFIDEYMHVHGGNYVSKAYVGRNPEISLETDIWGDDYIKIGWDYLLVKPKDIKAIDLYIG